MWWVPSSVSDRCRIQSAASVQTCWFWIHRSTLLSLSLPGRGLRLRVLNVKDMDGEDLKFVVIPTQQQLS